MRGLELAHKNDKLVKGLIPSLSQTILLVNCLVSEDFPNTSIAVKLSPALVERILLLIVCASEQSPKIEERCAPT